MDHALGVGRLEGLRHLESDPKPFLDWKRATLEALGQVLARHQFHGQEANALFLVQAVDHGDAGMVERRQQLCLAVEARQPLGIGRECLGQYLDRHVAIQRGVPGSPDLAHAARAERAGDLVLAELGAGFDCHCGAESSREAPFDREQSDLTKKVARKDLLLQIYKLTLPPSPGP